MKKIILGTSFLIIGLMPLLSFGEKIYICGKNSSLTENKSCVCNQGFVWEDPKDDKNMNCIPVSGEKIQPINTESVNTESINTGSVNTETVNTSINETNPLTEKLIKKIDGLFEQLKGRWESLEKEKKINAYKKLLPQIDRLLLKYKKPIDQDMLIYFKSLIEKEITLEQNSVNWESVTLEELLGNDISPGENSVGSVTPPKNFSCGDTLNIGGYEYTTKSMSDGKCWTTTSMKHITTSGNSWCYGDDQTNCEKNERLYDLSGALFACSTLGEGWKLPSDEEWKALEASLGCDVTGTGTGRCKGLGFSGSKLDGLVSHLSGFRDEDGVYSFVNYNGYWWSSTQTTPTSAYYRFMDYRYSEVNRYNYNTALGLAVVCIK